MGTVCSLPAFHNSVVCKNNFLERITQLKSATELLGPISRKVALPERLLQTIVAIASTVPNEHWHQTARLLVNSIPVGADTMPLVVALPPERLFRKIQSSCEQARRSTETRHGLDTSLLIMVSVGTCFLNWWVVASASALYFKRRQALQSELDQLAQKEHSRFVTTFLECANKLEKQPSRQAVKSSL